MTDLTLGRWTSVVPLGGPGRAASAPRLGRGIRVSPGSPDHLDPRRG
ncbi:hypothetical protein [Janibacter melonis]|nr:hypothetical protein [Janibacter melonis]